MRAVERDIDVSQWVLVEPFGQGEVLKMSPPDVVVDEHLKDVLETAIDRFLKAKHSEALHVRTLLDDPLESLLLNLSKLLVDVDVCVVEDRGLFLLIRISFL